MPRTCSPRKAAGLPPEQETEQIAAAAGLPAAVPLLAALGLAILVLCTLPAVHAQRHLERDHARVAAETREAEARVQRLRQELSSGARQQYLRIKATQTLLHRGERYIRERDARLKQKRAP